MLTPTPPDGHTPRASKAELIKKLLAKRGVATAAPTIRKRSKDTPPLLSYAQQRLWFMQQMHSESSAYNLFQSWKITGRLDVARLEAAFHKILDRHEVFRTGFTSSGETTEVQIHAKAPFKVHLHDFSKQTKEQQTQSLAELKKTVFRAPFSFQDCPLLRVHVVQNAKANFTLLVCVHHIVFDGWSISLLIDELRTLYQASNHAEQSSLPPLEYQYYDYALTQKELASSDQFKEQIAYWSKQLANLSPVDFPTDRKRPTQLSDQGSTQAFTLPETTLTQLHALAREFNCTLFMLLLAAWQVCIHRYSGSTDITIGSPVAGRQQAEWEPIIGFFTNMLVLRGDLSENPAFTDYLSQVKATTQAAYSNQDVPFELLVETLQPERNLSQNPLFQIAFSFQNLPQSTITLGDLQLEAETDTITNAKFDLLLALEESENSLKGLIEYSCDLFDLGTIQRLIENFKLLLESITAAPNRPVRDLPICSQLETTLLAQRPAPVITAQTNCIHQKFESQATRAPHSIALSHGADQITYTALNQQADRLAQYLHQQGVVANTIVGLCLEREPQALVAILAILKAGGAYLPLDPTYPEDRLRYVIEDSRTQRIVTSRSIKLPPALEVERINIEDILEAAPKTQPTPLIPPAKLGDLAYVIYTSGSTGKPKGVCIPHSNLSRLFEQTDHWFHFNQTDTWTLFHSLSFDFSVWEIWGALAHGGRLVIVPYWVSRSTDEFCQLLVDEQVTVLNQTPSAFSQLVQHTSTLATPPKLSLNWIIFGGEALDLPSLRPWFNTFPETSPKLVNMYGITETTVHVTYREISASDVAANLGSVIGQPIPDLAIEILDAAQQPVPCGVVGEMYVSGAGLAQGYLHRPELTVERFIEETTRRYKTGDLARYLPDGDIEYRGRSDFQVQVKGFRIELGEIQAALLEHPTINQAAVITLEDANGGQYLIAYCVTSKAQKPSPDEVRNFIAKSLPDYMLPAHYVYLDALPLTANNKLDRQALPQPTTTPQASTSTYVDAENDQERTLQTVCCEVIGIERISIQDNLFTQGVDSIRILQIRAKTRQQGYDFELQAAFRYQTIEALAKHLKPVTGPLNSPQAQPFALIPKSERIKIPDTVEDAYPLSALQSGMLFHSELNPDSAIYHDIFSYRLRAPYAPDSLTNVFEVIVKRHPILRTSFHRAGLIEPLQWVHKNVDLPIAHTDISQLEEPKQQHIIQQWMTQEKEHVYDWENPPLLRIATHRLSNDLWQFSLSLHHSILDGWSVSALLAEIFERYLAALDLQPNPSTAPIESAFSNFITLERACIESKESENFWRETLADLQLLPLPRWPENRGTNSKKRTVRNLEFTWYSHFTQTLSEIAKSTSTPIKNVLLAAHVKVMGILGNQSDVLTGLIANGRPEENDSEKTLGLFLNTVPLRIQVEQESWQQLIQNTFTAEQAIIPHRRYPLAEIQRLCNQRDLCETAFNFVNFHVLDEILASPHIDLIDAAYFDENNFALFTQFSIEPGTQQLNLQLKFDQTVFAEVQMERILGYYKRALETLATETQKSHIDWNPLCSEEQNILLQDFSGETLSHDNNVCLQDLLEQSALKQPQAPAILWQNENLTYAELDTQANAVAAALRATGITIESRVGLYLNRHPSLIIAMLGILKAGATYVPLDPAYPKDRIAFLFNDADMSAVITEQALLESLPKTEVTPFQIEDLLAQQVRTPETELPAQVTSPQNLAYIIYTSGSTGLPKGTAITHQNAVAMVHWAQSIYTPHDTRGMLASTSICFDLSVYEIFLTFANGGTLIIAENALELPELPAAEQVTLINTVPSAMAELVRSERIPKSVRIVNLAGEPLKASLADTIYQFPQIEKVYDLYGPSEDTTYSTFKQRIQNGPETIGRPVANTHLYLLDSHLNAVPIGTAGEIYLSGEGITRGYFARPDLSAARYRPDPFSSKPGTRMYQTGDLARFLPDGNLEFLGRLDHQVKIRGYRIELGEIQTALEKLPTVQEAIVIAQEDSTVTPKLVAYIAESTGADHDSNSLRQTLRKELPEYMVPAIYVFLETLPRTPNGKLNRKALPAPEFTVSTDDTNTAPPRNELERQLIQIWKEVLVVDSIGINDNFFALGGDSILMIQIVSRAREAGIQITTRHLYEHETVAELATVATTTEITNTEIIDPAGDLPLTPIQHWFFEQNFAQPNHWNQSILLKVQSALDLDALEKTFQSILTHHDALRLSFSEKDGLPIAQILAPAQSTSTLEVIRVDSSIAETCDRIQASLDIKQGPLIKMAYLQCADHDRIFMAIHHLAIDGVSWRILLQDLNHAYTEFEQGRTPKFPAKTTAFRHFAQAMQTYAKSSANLQNERSHWSQQVSTQSQALPTDHPKFVNSYAEETKVESRLNAEETTALLRSTNEAYNTQINDLLLAALQPVLKSLTQSDALTIHLEGHGRESLVSELDSSNTLGWFTALYPVKLDLSDQSDLGDTIRGVKETLRAIPEKGIGYGMLRYLAPQTNLAKSSAEISFNYLGQTESLTQDGQRFLPSSEPRGHDFGPENIRPHLIDISAIVIGNQLQVDWRYPRGAYTSATITALNDQFLNQLRAIITHCSTKAQTHYTPSDFSIADIDQSELDSALDEIEF